MKKIVIFFLLLTFAHKVLGTESYMLLDSPDDDQKIEVVVYLPDKQSYPLLLFLHGAADGKGIESISPFWFEHWSSKGYGVAGISLPGYGKSTGTRDFCGQGTLNSLHTAINLLKEKLDVSDFGIIGFGQGGLAAILLATTRKDIRCIVCSNGAYDLLRHQVPGDALMQALNEKGYDLDTHGKHDLTARSPIMHISSIQAPLFLLHRKHNPLVNEKEVIDFYHAMIAANKQCYLALKDQTAEKPEQKLTTEEILSEAELWIDSLMLSV